MRMQVMMPRRILKRCGGPRRWMIDLDLIVVVRELLSPDLVDRGYLAAYLREAFAFSRGYSKVGCWVASRF